MTDLFKKILPPDASYSDAIVSYWKLLTLDLLYRYGKTYLEYNKALENEIDNVTIERLRKELIKLRGEIVSVIVSLVTSIFPHLLQLYYGDRKRLQHYPEPIKKWIKTIVESGPEYLEQQLLEMSENLEIKDLLEVIASIGVVLVELNLIPIDLRSAGL